MGPPPGLESEGQLVEGEDMPAAIMNKFFIDKVGKIRAQIMEKRRQQQQQQQEWQSRELDPSPGPSTLSSSFSSSS